MSENYQGWTNYPTWAVALWIDNDEYMQNEVIEMASEWVDDDNDLATLRIREWLFDFIEDNRPDLPPSMYSDLLGWAIEMVDLYELAEHYLTAAKESAQ
jgi:hypothetical protein